MTKSNPLKFESKNSNKSLESYFQYFRSGIIGSDYMFDSLGFKHQMLYADWIASGRMYRPIDLKIMNDLGPIMANTHSFSSESGKLITYHYQEARAIIKKHVNASVNDVLVTTGTGMTGALNKLLRILDLPQKGKNSTSNFTGSNDKPVVFLTHMEHHSNQAAWFELNVDVVILPPSDDLLVAPSQLEKVLEQYQDRTLKIGAFTACSNVTGIKSNYHELARIMHKNKGLCFIDFAASAPYVRINMRPKKTEEKLDAIFFSPHKFLGGPGSCGILLYDKNLHKKLVPDNPGGGNVKWTMPCGTLSYHKDLEVREDGGTPGIVQTVRAALAIKLKEQMNTSLIKQREQELLSLFHNEFKNNDNILFLGAPDVDRIGCVAFNLKNIHYNLVVRLLNDRYGIQVRGGWSCASTYAHYLFKISFEQSKSIMNAIDSSDLSSKPGWVRISLHPTMLDKEVLRITDAIKEIILNYKKWETDYRYDSSTNEFLLVTNSLASNSKVKDFYKL